MKEYAITKPFAKPVNLWIINLVTALLILLFTYASASKLLDYDNYYGQINSQPFPNWMTPYLVWGIPAVEVLVTVLLIVNKTRLIGLYASFFLMTSFSIYIGLILLNVFNKVPCSCGGIISHLRWKGHLLFNLVFVISSLIAILLYRRDALSRKG